MSKADLLDEYVKITKTVDNIQEKINTYKKIIEDKIEHSTNTAECIVYREEFELFVSDIKHDPQISQKYRRLKQRQQMLRDLLLNDTNTNTDTTYMNVDEMIHSLKSKYETENINNNNINISIRTTPYETLLNDIKSNLK